MGQQVSSFSRGEEQLEVHRNSTAEGFLLTVNGDGPPRTYFFEHEDKLEEFQRDFEKFLIGTGWLLLGETVSRQGLLGILLVVAGAWGLNLDRAGRHPRTWLAPFAAIVDRRGSRLMLMVAAIYSVTAVLGKGALGYMPDQAMVFGALYFALLGGLTLVFFGAREPAMIRRALLGGPAVWSVAALMSVMVVTHFLALAQTATAYMIAVKRTSILFGILLGAWLFRERRLGQHLAAGGLMVSGVALILVE